MYDSRFPWKLTPFFKKNLDKMIDWEYLSINPNIFERDYIKMSKTRT